MVAINETTIAMTFAVLGVVFSVAWILLALYGISSLRDIKATLEDSEEPNDT